ncbi:MAG: hypothetical protein EPO32_13410 [Anaerolineae bacterium]|nr:MAG: hypothetical protein EPO32_13410 [Anaerolineae bacterium]
MLPYDDKGKIFTEVVSKKLEAVVIQTTLNRIEGDVHIRPDERLKDELNHAEPFLAITDAIIYDLNGVEIRRTAFVAVNRGAIQWVTPKDDSE